jgi:O-antigen ligase
LPSIPILGLFGYALALTQSRGGFIALLAALLVLFRTRFSWWKSVPLALIVLPIMFMIFDGRMTGISTSEDTAQERIQLWSEGLEFFREAPLFGIGQGEFADQVRQVAHNSFVHSYAELGFFGGTVFLGAFFCALWGLYRLRRFSLQIRDPQLTRLRPYAITILAAYAVGLLSLSRAYIVPTYMVLGLGTAYIRLASVHLPAPVLRFNGQLLLWLGVVSALSLVGIKVFVNVFVQYG